MGLDPGFGSSNIGVCITELVDGLVKFIHTEEDQRPDFYQMINTTGRLLDEYNIKFDKHCRIFVDGTIPSCITALKDRVDDLQFWR